MEESSLLPTLLWLLVPLLFGAALYIYFGATLMIIARKTDTSGAGLAWIPIANLYLMCKIGRRPGWWFLLLLIPLVGLIALPILWMSIAEMRGKPAWTGALLIVPVIGLVIPAYLALGPNTSPALAAGGFQPRKCLACGNEIVADETFCRMCGEAALTMVASKPVEEKPRTSTGQMVAIGGGVGVAVLLIFGIIGWLALTSIFAYAAPERQPPEIPERTQGTLEEFPVDTDKEDPLAPEVVSTEDLQDKIAENSGENEKQVNKRLPPGLTRDDLRDRDGKTITTTVYRPRRRQKDQQPTGKEDIYISVVRIPSKNGDPIAVNIAQKTGGDRTGTKVQSPRGGSYTGSKIQSDDVLIYVLEKQGSDILIIIYTPNRSMRDDATRLAQNVGNGRGLNDYPETRQTVWTLPQKPPNQLTLAGFKTTTRAELGLSQSDLDSAGKNEDERKLIEYFSQFIPERIIEARYRDSAGKEWTAGVFDYDSAGRAWRTWLFLDWTLGFSGKKISLKHGSGFYADTDDGKKNLFFQKGPYLIFIQAPSTAGTNQLVAFADGFQI